MEQRETTLHLSELPDQPTYNVKAVCMRTGITAATLRAWERRYGVPSPNRSSQGYRLYSERDIATLYWLIQQTTSGVSIGHAAQQLQDLLSHDPNLEIKLPASPTPQRASVPRSPDVIAAELADAYAELDERQCNDLIAEASALYTLETTLISILRQALLTLRDDIRTHQGNLTAENFAFNHLRQHVLGLIQASPVYKVRRSVLMVGFSNERAELDLLICTLLLRRAGYAGTYMSIDFDPQRLRTELDIPNAGVLVFHSHHPENARKLSGFPAVIEMRGLPVRTFYSGHAPDYMPELEVPFMPDYLGADLKHIVRELSVVLRQSALAKEIGHH
jgi:MerR family transcriptional regulator, light-induced transcriptional regulator